MAALPLRAPTAYHLWRRALGIFRVKVSREQRAVLNVLSFGGGVGELFLMLAKAEGHNAYFCSGSPERRAALEKQGIVGIDQKAFNRFKSKDDIKALPQGGARSSPTARTCTSCATCCAARCSTPASRSRRAAA